MFNTRDRVEYFFRAFSTYNENYKYYFKNKPCFYTVREDDKQKYSNISIVTLLSIRKLSWELTIRIFDTVSKYQKLRHY